MRTLTPNDFKRLPEDGAQFETLICQLLEAIGYRILEKPAVGTEGGRDILIERVIKDAMVEQRERVVVQCKHKAHSDRAVNDSDVGVFQNVMTRYQARGYLLVTSTRVTENLAKALREYTKAEVNSLKWANFWDVDEIIKHLNKYPFVQETFFPRQLTPAEALADEVQVWLNAVGYKTVNQQSDAHHVDFVVTVRQGLDIKHLLLRCIDSEITTSRLKTLEDDLDAQKISEAWIISDRRVSSSAQNYTATRTTIIPYSLSSFVSNIFASYFDWLCSLVEESDIQHYYVDLACYRPELDRSGKEIGRDHESVIDVYVDNWLIARDANHLSILGEFGSGKTWFCRHYAYRQLKRYLANPVQERLPILINLRDYDGQMEVVSRIGKLLEEQGVQLGGGSEALKELNRRGKLLLIFDGFDEIAVKVDYETLVNHFWNLAEVVVPGSKALLTCRTGYFRYATEAEKVMHGEEPGRKTIVIKPPRFEVLYLESFTENQIREVITRRRGEEVAETILNNPDLKELAQQPVIIEMLVEVLPDLQPDTPINKSEIYRLAVDRWLDRDILTGRTFMSRQGKLFFMMELAWEMFATEKLKVHYTDLPDRINRHLGLADFNERDHFDYDIRTKSFLRRDNSGYYEFSHKSLVEFLVALRIYQDLDNAKPETKLADLLSTQLTRATSADKLGGDPPDETHDEVYLSWAPAIMFLWHLGQVGRQAIKDFLKTEEGGYFFTGNLELLEALGQTQDKEAIPLLLKCLY